MPTATRRGRAPVGAVSRPLFVYGSLREAAVRLRVLGPRPGAPAVTVRPAVLRGYVRQMVDAFDYPFVVPAGPDDAVAGDLLGGLTADDYGRLDEYEDVGSGLYARVGVTVEAAGGPAAVAAWVYRKGPAAPP